MPNSPQTTFVCSTRVHIIGRARQDSSMTASNLMRGPQLPSFDPYSSGPSLLEDSCCSHSPHNTTHTSSRHHAPPVEAPGPRGSRRGAPRRRRPLPPRGRGPPAATLRPPRGRFRGQSPPAFCSSVPSPHCALLNPHVAAASRSVSRGRIGARSDRAGRPAFNDVAWSRARAVWC